MPPSLPQFSAARARSYIFRLPLFTRCIILMIVLFWLVSLQSAWDLQQWGALIPKEIGLATSSSFLFFLELLQELWRISSWLMYDVCVVYRTNTFPLVHANFFHAFMNILALTPLLERFEAEYGTLTTLALFLGRMYTSIAWNRPLWWQGADFLSLHSFIYDSSIALHVSREGNRIEHYSFGSQVWRHSLYIRLGY